MMLAVSLQPEMLDSVVKGLANDGTAFRAKWIYQSTFATAVELLVELALVDVTVTVICRCVSDQITVLMAAQHSRCRVDRHGASHRLRMGCKYVLPDL
jgi:hypothetical protein